MSFVTAATLIGDFAWNNRVGLIALDAAVDILSEAPETEHHAERRALAQALLRGEHTGLFARAVLTNETVRTTPPEDVTDSDLQFTVASVFSHIALALHGDAA